MDTILPIDESAITSQPGAYQAILGVWYLSYRQWTGTVSGYGGTGGKAAGGYRT
jgi:hypothetical protein